jgi:hypothetical protein
MWDPARWPVYFLAQNVAVIRYCAHCATDHLLAVNELQSEDAESFIDGWLRTTKGINLFLDSGVFNLAMTHARNHKLSMDQALTLAPDEIDGFDDLFARYVALVRRWDDLLWGYVEIDQGGRENKIKTRARLEALGLRPIPVFHPFNDGWDYFDYLAERYDRICFGNVVQADPWTRKRLVATAWDRKRKYPDLWIHLLGMTPSPVTVAFPCNSCDSSTWMGAQRWGQMSSWAATQRLWDVGPGWIYDRDADLGGARGHRKSYAVTAFDSELMGRCMRRMVADQRRELGADPTGVTIKGLAEAQPASVT